MATITRWAPFQEMVSLREAMNHLLEESVVRNVPGNSNGIVPALDVSETAEAFFVELAVPGLQAEDLNITFENNILTISGEVKQGEERKERNYHRVERRFGRFQRTLSLPSLIKADAINAKLEHGVLTLSIPKAEEVKPRRINVSVN